MLGIARRRPAFFAALLVAGASVTSAPAPARAKTLVYCSEGNPEALNPQLVTTTTGMTAARPMFNNLVEFEPGTTTVVPALAETWTVSDDGLDYTFHLRSGVKFHSTKAFQPSRDLNADDVLFSLLRQWRVDHPYHAVSGARYDYFKDAGMPDILRAIDKLDARTVRIRLARPDAPFLANLAMAFNSILSAEYAEQLLREGRPERLDVEPVGTGPFAFADFQKDVTVRYRAFPEHWAGRPPLDTLVFSITPNPAVRLTKLKAGECHVMAFPSPADAPRIAADPTLELLQQEGLNVGYLSLNASRPPFDDRRVRRAVNMAIDKDAIVDAVYGATGKVAKNPIPPTLWSYHEGTRPYPFDPGQAQQLLAQAGYGAGFETELWYMPVSRPYNPNAKRVAEMIEADLAKVGIRLKLVTAEWNAYREKLQAGEPPMALYGWTGDNGDPDNFLDVLLGCTAARVGGNNVAKWCNRDYDALVTGAKASRSRSEREALYRRAQEIFVEEAPWVPIAHSIVHMAIRKGVSGFVMDPLGRPSFGTVGLTQ